MASRPPAPSDRPIRTILAFDTATEVTSVALGLPDGSILSHEDAGAAKASAVLLPAIRGLLERAGLRLDAVDAIGFGRGPGAFTGLRTACSVAQGLAFGLDRPVLPIDTLLSIAEDARAGNPRPARTWALLDARMDELYAACYAFDGRAWSVRAAPELTSPERLVERWRAEPPDRVAGAALAAFGARLDAGRYSTFPEARPRAVALLALAAADAGAGRGVDAALALPLYVRDKVAQTTAERMAARAAAAVRSP